MLSKIVYKSTYMFVRYTGFMLQNIKLQPIETTRLKRWILGSYHLREKKLLNRSISSDECNDIIKELQIIEFHRL